MNEIQSCQRSQLPVGSKVLPGCGGTKLIKYKVVTIDRKSIIVPQTSKFCLTYNKGNIVKALPGTLGVLVFKSLHDALQFNIFQGKIIKVRPIGRMKPTPFNVAVTFHGALQTTIAIKAYNSSGQVKMLPIPQGTQCYNTVEVLE